MHVAPAYEHSPFKEKKRIFLLFRRTQVLLFASIFDVLLRDVGDQRHFIDLCDQ